MKLFSAISKTKITTILFHKKELVETKIALMCFLVSLNKHWFDLWNHGTRKKKFGPRKNFKN